MKKYLLLIWIFAFQALQAQVFPVQVTPQLIPPYSLNLSDYQNAAREQVIVNLLLSDVTESNREVTLKFSMSNTAGFAIESAPVVVGALPVFLNGGIPLRLTNADLQAYFQLQNLRGISPQQYGQPLPDGVYQFCFEVFDRRSGQAISRKSCATAFLVLNDPPFLNVPSRGEAIPQKEPQNIVFQWTPRHLNATNVEYEFTLVEVWDELVDPQTAFLASRPYYQTSTRATTLLYGPGEPALLPDKNYAWRVRAVINDGISQTSVFKNNGYSEIYYFEHNAECAPPLFAISESKTTTTQNIRWQQALYQGYNVQYRKKKAYTQTNDTKETKRKGKKRKKGKGSKNASYSGIKAVDGGSPWFEINTFSEQATIFNLEKATTYEFRVGGRCRPNGGFAYGNIQEFTTASSNDQASGYQCGILPNIQISNQEPLERLGVNEVFTAGDFPVTVKFIAQGNRVSGEPGSGAPVLGANGTYSGWGFITVPYLADTRIKVIFNNIKLNSDYQLIEGVVETDYDKDWDDVDDIGDEIDTLNGIVKDIAGLFKRQQEILDEYREETDPDKKDALLEEYNEAFVKTDDKIKELLNDPEVSEEDKDELRKVKDIDKIVDNDLSNKEVDNYKKLNTQKAQTVNEIVEKYNASEDVAEEAPSYNDKTLFQKILLELRCAYINNKGKQQLSYLSRLPFMTVFRFADDLNTPSASKHNVYLELINEDSIELDLSKSIDVEEGEFERGTFNKGQYTFKYKYTYDNLVLYANQEGINSYLKPSISDIRNGFDSVWQQIQLDDGLNREEVQLIRTIAACDATFFTPKSRYDIIKALYSFDSSVVETTEDLMLDLMSTCQKKDATAFLTHFSEDFKLFKDLYGEMDEDDWWYVNSNENNNTRFLTTLYSLWIDSDFSNPKYSKYSYVNAPKTLMYDNKSLLYRGFSFREVDFELNESTKKIDVVKTDPGDLDDQEQEIYNYAYHIFQPISLVFVESENAGKFGGDRTPAFFYMGLENLEDLKARRAATGLTIDVALTFSGIGNLAHLNKLSKGYKVAKVTIAGLEIGTSVIDMVISYSSACDGNEEFCKKIQAYNFWLQMATFSSDVVVNRMVRRSAKESLESSTKSSVDEDLIKHLEDVSRINKGELVVLIEKLQGDIPNFYNSLLKSGYKIKKSKDFIKIYAKNGIDVLAEISENSVRIKYKGWGGDIITKSDRTTTCIAKFDDQLDTPGSQFIKYELPEGAFGRGADNKGGINILDVDDVTYNALQNEARKLLKSSGKSFTNVDVIREANEIFWKRYNLPFLEEAFKRGDDIRLLSDPTTLFGSTGFYQREIEVITQGWQKADGSFVPALKTKYDYQFNELTKTYEKIK